MAPLTSSAINKSKTVAPKAVARRRPAAPPPKPQAAPKSPPTDPAPDQDAIAGASQSGPQSQAPPTASTPVVEPTHDRPLSQSAPTENGPTVPPSESAGQITPTPPPTQQTEKAPTPQADIPVTGAQTEVSTTVDAAPSRSVSRTAASPAPATNRQTPTPTPDPAPAPLQPEAVSEPSDARTEPTTERESNSVSETPALPTTPSRGTPNRESSEAVPAQASASPRVPSPSPVAGVKRKRGTPQAAQPSPPQTQAIGGTIPDDAISNGAEGAPQDFNPAASGDHPMEGEQQIGTDQPPAVAPGKAAPKPAQPRAKRQKKATVADGQPTEEGQSEEAALSAAAKPKAKPRAKRKPKSAARIVEDEDGNVIDEPEPAPAKEKPARKPRQRKPKKTPEEAAAQAEGEGSESEDPELHEIDVTVTTMSHLTRDRRVGKTSEREVKMAAIDWPEVIRKRQEAADAIARGANVEPESGEKPVEGGEGAGEGERDAETPGPRVAISGPRLRLDADGNLVVDETSLRIDRQAQAEANAANLQVTEEDDLTQRVNRVSWIGNRKKEPTERLPFFKMKSDPWSDEETDRFYEALRMFGTDFFIISKMFVPKTRRQIKLKFIREERLDPSRVNRALAGEDTAMSLEHFAEATGQNLDNFKDPRILEEELRVEGEEQREEIALKKKEIEEAKKQRDVQMAAREKDTAKRQAQKKEKAIARANRRRGVFGTGTF